MQITRREAVQAGVVMAAAATGVSAKSTSAAELDLKTAWVDGHSHIWSPDLKKWPLANGQTNKDLDPPSFTDDELLEEAAKEGVGRVNLIQHHPYHMFDNSYLLHAHKRHPGRFAITAMVDDTKAHPDVEMTKLKEQGVRAFRITSLIRGKSTWLEGPGIAAMWKQAAKNGQVLSTLINPEDLPDVDAMCKKFPDTTIVIDHFARIGMMGPAQDADLKLYLGLAKHKNVHCKLSAYYALGEKKPPHDELIPMIRKTLDAFGLERCMWASDSPYQLQKGNSYASSISLIRDRIDGLSKGDKEQLLRKTCAKVYFD